MNETQKRFINTQLIKIANSLSQTGKHNRTNMIFFPLNETYNILKIKDWLALNKENIEPWEPKESIATAPDHNWYTLGDSKFKESQEKNFIQKMADDINERIMKDLMQEFGNKKNDSFKAEPNGEG